MVPLHFYYFFFCNVGSAYITPPAGFTQWHQDGRGGVDSGHIVIEGYNEVVMLQRMPEEHKWRAISILTGLSNAEQIFHYLYGEPHDDAGPLLYKWPSNKQILDCRIMGCVELAFWFSL